MNENDDEENDPYRCPKCGERDVRCSGGGERDCQSCPWDFRPARDTSRETTKQVGLGDYNE